MTDSNGAILDITAWVICPDMGHANLTGPTNPSNYVPLNTGLVGGGSGAANNSAQRQNQQPNRLKDCAKAYYGAGTAATRIGTLIAAIPFPKSWVGLPSALGSGSFTNLPSWLSLGSGTAASGSNLLRIGGRMAGPIAIASGAIDAAALSMCTADYVPNFLYTVAKYDPF